MELSQLRYVVAIADTGNFTKAARAIEVAQPSLSQQVAKLEAELGHRLFHRIGRRAVPTEAGELFIRRARKILFEVDDVSSEIRDNPEILRTIKVGAIPTIAPYLLPALIEQARRDLPNLNIHTQEAFQRDVLRAVVQGKLAMGLVMLPVKEPQLATESLFTETLVVAIGQHHHLAAKRKLTVADLAEEPFIMLGEGSALSGRIRGFFGANDFSPQIAHTCAQVATLKLLVAQGLGVTLLPKLAQSPDDQPEIVYRELAGASASREIGVVRHFQRYQTTGANQFLGLLRQRFGPIK
jgi:LysR family transcriptional regulator, hydrogen peroxide-inducible genes activator